MGTFLRTFTHGHVQQVDKISAAVLAGLTGQVPGLLAGGREDDGMVFIDVDDTIRAVHGYAEQGAGFGYSRVRGLNVQLATASTPTSAPVLVRARLRRGNIASATGSPRLLAQAITTARAAGARGRVLARADSAYYLRAFLAAAVRHDAWFSVTARMNLQVVKAIAAIDDDAWTPTHYPNAVFDEQAGAWVSDAQVAEVAFTSLPKAQQITCRLVVRRVKRQQPRTSPRAQRRRQRRKERPPAAYPQARGLTHSVGVTGFEPAPSSSRTSRRGCLPRSRRFGGASGAVQLAVGVILG